MRVVSVLSGKAVWLFETVELNPRGLDVHPIYVAVKNRYSFSTPKTREEVENPKDGVKFEHGNFKIGSDSIAVTLSLFNDGLVAETMAGTSAAEAFLEDVADFVKKQHGLYFEPEMVSRRTYSSSLLIESTPGLSKLSESLGAISASLGAETGRKFQARSVSIGFDPTEPLDGVGPFTIENRASQPFAANRFFSLAPVSTEAHIKILEQFEKLMS